MKSRKELPELPKKEYKKFSWEKVEPFYTIRGLKNKWMLRQRDKIILVNMELFNGDFRTFYVPIEEEKFDFEDKTYCIDTDFLYYNYDAKVFMCDYHQGFSIPIRRRIPLKKIKDTLNAIGDDEVEFATNPSTLKKFLQSKIIEMILKGAELDRWMRMMFWISVFILIIVAIILIIDVQHSGILQNIGHAVQPPK